MYVVVYIHDATPRPVVSLFEDEHDAIAAFDSYGDQRGVHNRIWMFEETVIPQSDPEFSLSDADCGG